MMMLRNLSGKRITLASGSPRRRELLKGLELDFEVIVRETDESFPADLKAEQIALHVASAKADAFNHDLASDQIVITADTVVWINDHVLNKPSSRDEAIAMITELSGNEHHVYTGVCIRTKEKNLLFYDNTKVTFTSMTASEIAHYVDEYKPLDKAGAYGAQDWIGLVGIQKLEGSYFNVMGLPVHLVYAHLKNF